MSNRIHEIALRAWQENADTKVSPEEWMALYIKKLCEYLLEECYTVLNTDISAEDDFGPNGGKGMQRAVEVLKSHFKS